MVLYDCITIISFEVIFMEILTNKVPSKMKAAVLFGFNDVRVVEKDVPEPSDDEVLIKVVSCGVCAGDIKIITRGMPAMPPFGEFIIGHEYAGEIVATGRNVDEFRAGDRVAVEVHKGCGRCRNCIMGMYTMCLNYGNIQKGHRANGFTTNGGFAEYVVNHVNTLTKIPQTIDFDEATTITTAGTSLYAIDMAGGYIAGDSVVVMGPGPIGLMAVQCAKALGAGLVILTGTKDDRLVKGKTLGADYTINIREKDPIEEVKTLTGGFGSDLTLVAAGSGDALDSAIKLTRKGGNIVLLAHFNDPVTVDVGVAVQNGINIYTVRGEGRLSVHRAMSLMEEGKIKGKPLITHTFPLEKINEAFDTFNSRKGGAIKVVVHP